MTENRFKLLAECIWANEINPHVSETERFSLRATLLEQWLALARELGPPKTFETIILHDWALSLAGRDSSASPAKLDP